MTRKKIIFVIVEGSSDETALGAALSQLYRESSVYVHIMHGDITSRNGVFPNNIILKIAAELKNYAKSSHFRSKDFWKIIHIVDTDGVFIPDSQIKECEACLKPIYKEDGIYTHSKSDIIKRNRNKRENLSKLRSVNIIWKIPYKVYYMSCNLDHVLHNKRNSEDEEKEKDAYSFAKKYNKNQKAFINFMCKSDFSVTSGYKESWDFIMEDMNSVNRFSNFALCIQKEIDKHIS